MPETIQPKSSQPSSTARHATLVGAGIAKSNTALLTVWQKALQDLIDSGAYGKLIAAYGLTPVTSAQINQGPKQSSASPSP